jgi:hypothetical protein
MAVAKVYGPALGSILSKKVDWVNDSVKFACLDATYTPNQDTHEFFSDVSSFEAAGSGYVTGGYVVTGRTATYDSGTNTLTLDCANPSLTAATIDFQTIVFYVNTGTPSTSPLICYVQFDTEQSPVAQDVTFSVPATGLFTVVTA